MPERHDEWYFISSVRRRVHIISVPDDEWTYELITEPASAAKPGDTVLRDQVAFDEILADLQLIKLDVGRKIVNVLIRHTRLDSISPETTPTTQRMHRKDAPRQ